MSTASSAPESYFIPFSSTVWRAAGDPWAKLEREVESWRSLSADWADDDGRTPPAIVLDGVLSFLRRIHAAGLPLPNAAVDSDGEVALRWKSNSSSASASFLPDGHIVAYVSRIGERKLFKLDAVYSENLDLSGLFNSVRSLS